VENESNFFDFLPDELGVEICSHLPLVDVVNIAKVYLKFAKWSEILGLRHKKFKYKRDWDDGGILYWIGTNRYRENYRNPACSGRVGVSAIHKYPNFVGRKAFWVKNVGDDKNSWYAIDFGPNKLVNPNYYTITYGNDGEGWEPRNWKLVGSVDEVNWDVLRQHSNDRTLSGAFAHASWKVPMKAESGYRYFRLVQTGKNKSGFYTFFICCFEIYGDLFYYDSLKEELPNFESVLKKLPNTDCGCSGSGFHSVKDHDMTVEDLEEQS